MPHCCPRCRSEAGKDGPPFTAYWKAAITNCVGPACGLQALKYISYPAQVGALVWAGAMHLKQDAAQATCCTPWPVPACRTVRQRRARLRRPSN